MELNIHAHGLAVNGSYIPVHRQELAHARHLNLGSVAVSETMSLLSNEPALRTLSARLMDGAP